MADNVPFSNLGDNQFKLAAFKSVNFKEGHELTFDRNDMQQCFFDTLNRVSENFIEDSDEDEFGNIASKCKYFSLEDFKAASFNTSKHFSVLHLNIHSIQAHIDELRDLILLTEFDFDFICISESKIISGTNPQLDISMEGYQSPIGTPTESAKGGVLIYVKLGISVKPRTDQKI